MLESEIKIMEMEVDNVPGDKSLLMRKKEIEQWKNKQPSSHRIKYEYL